MKKKQKPPAPVRYFRILDRKSVINIGTGTEVFELFSVHNQNLKNRGGPQVPREKKKLTINMKHF